MEDDDDEDDDDECPCIATLGLHGYTQNGANSKLQKNRQHTRSLS